MSPVDLRLMTGGDLLFGDGLRALAGWNQTLEDWRRFLTVEPDGCFIAEWNGTPAGTAVTTVYGPELAWIGMILVHPDYRRRGIGNALLERCIEHLQRRKVRCIKLDATPAGKMLYDGLGFKAEWTLSRWVGVHSPPRPTPPDSRVRNWQKSDARMMERLDAEAFGVSRQRIIQALAHQSLCALVLESEPGRIAGYGLLRKGSQGVQLGPVVAESAGIAFRLIESLLACIHGERIFWDIPHQNEVAGAWVKEKGFIEQRSLTRMYLGKNSAPGDPQKQFALAGPELG